MPDNPISWIKAEPVSGLLLILSAVGLLGSALSKSKETSPAPWPWLRRITVAFVKTVLFLGLLWAFHVLIENNNKTFNSTHKASSAAKRRDVQALWGETLLQEELVVNHFANVARQEEVPRKDPAAPPLYRTVVERQPVPQNSIIGFRGQVDMQLSEPEKRKQGYALYNGYTVNARYAYDVINNSDLETEVEFSFPLSPKQILYEDFEVTLDDQNISSQLLFAADAVSWKSVMRPQQQREVVVAYTSKGMEDFFYHVPAQREIRNFALTLTVDSRAFFILVDPQTDLTGPKYTTTEDQKGAILSWRLDRAIMAPKLGIALAQPEKPYAPYDKIRRVLENGPYAQALMAASLALTLLIWGQPVRLLDFAFLSGAYGAQFLVIAGASDYLGLWGSLALGAFLAGLLTLFLFRNLSSLPLRILAYVLAGFFIVVYPLTGLINKVAQRNAFDTIVQVGLIVYFFGLALFRQTRGEKLSGIR
jgi:hypothetical protein